MSDRCCAEVVPLHRPWWRRVAEDLLHRRDGQGAVSASDLSYLDARTLRDIGFGDALPSSLAPGAPDQPRW